jgi:hypothetical protein
MPDLKADIAALKNPSNITKASLANSPYVLRKIFKADPKIRRLIAAGEKVVPFIIEETREARVLDEITLSAFAYIIENVKVETAPQIFGARFRKAVENPGPFFVHFAAHAMRSSLHLPIKPLKMVYSREELVETQNKLR